MTTNNDCNVDLGHPCDADNGEPCASCKAQEAYWCRQWEQYGRHEARYSEADIRDAYSDPTERAKRDSLLRGNYE